MKTCKLHCSLVYQSISQCIGTCHLKCKPVNISQRQSILRDPILQNILGDRLLYPGLLTDTPGTSVADRSSYTLIVADRYSSISIHSKCISQVTDWYIRIQCSWQDHILCWWLIFGCTLHVTGHYTLGSWLIFQVTDSAADTGLCILCRWQIFRYTIRWQTTIPRITDWHRGTV